MSSLAADPTVEPSLRERKKAQTRSAIHEAALRLVDADGLDGVTVERICADADVSPRTFFNYFPSKGAAVLGVADSIVDDETRERFRAAPGGVMRALCELLGAGVTQALPERRRLKDLAHRHPELQRPLQEWMGRVRDELLALAEERTGDRASAVLAVSLVFAATSVVMQDDDRSTRPTAERLHEVVQALGRMATR